MKKLLSLALLSIVYCSLFGQIKEPCGFDQYINELDQEYPGIADEIDAQYLKAIDHIYSQKLSKKEGDDTTYLIPVVFHIIYNNEQQNLHDSFLISQIRIINECFRRKNPDTTDTRDIFKPIAGDTKN